MTRSDETVSSIVARWACSLTYADMPDAVRRRVRRSLIDFLGVTIRGSQSDLAQRVRRLTRTADVEASVIGTTLRCPAPEAAFLNGVAASVLELDDVHADANAHPSSTVLPAVLAAAQSSRVCGRELISSVAAAFEIATRLGEAVRAQVSPRGFHCTPLTGATAAVVGVGKVLGQDACRITRGIGLAVSNTASLCGYSDGWHPAWCVNVGRLGRESILSAELAGHGFPAPLDIFEDARGFLAFTGESRLPPTFPHSLGRDWAMLGTSVKVYPFGLRAHAAIDAADQIRSAMTASPDQIEEIVVETSSMGLRMNGQSFESLSDAQMSIPFAVAKTLLHGPPSLNDLSAENLGDSAIRNLSRRVRLVLSEDPSIADPGKFAAGVTISTPRERLSAKVLAAKGDPLNPVDDPELERKFVALVEGRIDDGAIGAILRIVGALGEDPDDDGLDLDQLFGLCAARQTA